MSDRFEHRLGHVKVEATEVHPDREPLMSGTHRGQGRHSRFECGRFSEDTAERVHGTRLKAEGWTVEIDGPLVRPSLRRAYSALAVRLLGTVASGFGIAFGGIALGLSAGISRLVALAAVLAVEGAGAVTGRRTALRIWTGLVVVSSISSLIGDRYWLVGGLALVAVIRLSFDRAPRGPRAGGRAYWKSDRSDSDFSEAEDDTTSFIPDALDRYAAEFEVDHPRAEVWEVFWDVDRLSRCIPGCTGAREVEEFRMYEASIEKKIGPFLIRLALDIEVRDITEFERVWAIATGSDKRLRSNIRLWLTADFVERDPTTTTVNVASAMEVTGVLGNLDPALAEVQVDLMLREFTQALQAELVNSSSARQARPGRGEL